MRILFDFQAAVTQTAGVGRYTRSLARALASTRGDDEIALFWFDFRGNAAPPPIDGASGRPCRWCPGALAHAMWKSRWGLPFDRFAGPADLYHFPNFLVPPLRAGKSVVTIHDLSFLRYPSTTERRNLAQLRARLPETVERADAILTPSRFSAAEVAELLDVDDSRVFAVHPGLDEDFSRPDPEAIAATRRRLGLGKPYVLHVGTLEPRKNLALLVEAFGQLDFDGELVLAGRRGWKVGPILEAIRSSPRRADVRELGVVPDADLAALYAGAEVFVFPSRYEGFGFPPLESMRCGTPVIASRAGSLAEVLADGAAFPDGTDADAWADAIGRLLHDDGRREALRERGRAVAARYSWEESARRTWEIYRAVGS